MARKKVLYNQLVLGKKVQGLIEAADLLGSTRSIVNNSVKLDDLPEGTQREWGKTARKDFSRREVGRMALYCALDSTGNSKCWTCKPRCAHSAVESP